MQLVQTNYWSVEGKYHGALRIVKNFLVVYTPRCLTAALSPSEFAGDFLTMSVTIRDVAKAAEVSTATVSNVLNKTGKMGRETRRLVLATVKKLGYIRDVHARNLASRDRRTLGIIVSDIENPFFPEVIKSFETRAQELGYDAILSDTNYDPR